MVKYDSASFILIYLPTSKQSQNTLYTYNVPDKSGEQSVKHVFGRFYRSEWQ